MADAFVIFSYESFFGIYLSMEEAQAAKARLIAKDPVIESFLTIEKVTLNHDLWVD